MSGFAVDEEAMAVSGEKWISHTIGQLWHVRPICSTNFIQNC